MDEHALRSLFARIVTAALAAPIGCTPAVPPQDFPGPDPQKPPRSTVVCKPNQWMPVLLSGVTTAMPLDAIEIRRARGPKEVGELVEAGGDVCGALDTNACDAARLAVAPDDGFLHQCQPGWCHHFILVRRGEKIAAAKSVDEVVRIVTPVDTENDALLLAWASGHSVSCKDGALAGSFARTAAGFSYTFEAETSSCPPVTSRLVVAIGTDGSVREVSREKIRQGEGCIMIGRRPPGLCDHGIAPGGSALGRWLARVATLEAASVPAFLRLERELATHGAPAELLDACRRAAEDEVRHAAITAALARDHGATPEAAEIAEGPDRDLEAIAIDNAVEGCVRETYGALVGAWQRAAATDAELGAAFGALADDEAAHAALALRIAAHCDARLSEDARGRVREARRRAIEDLREELAVSLDPDLISTAGLPSPASASVLMDGLEAMLWQARDQGLPRNLPGKIS